MDTTHRIVRDSQGRILSWSEGNLHYVVERDASSKPVVVKQVPYDLNNGYMKFKYNNKGELNLVEGIEIAPPVLSELLDDARNMGRPPVTAHIEGGQLVSLEGGNESLLVKGWKDLIGDAFPKSAGAGSPSLVVFRNNVRWFAYALNDEGDMNYHMPHDWAPGTDLFLHVHWAHNGTNISGTFTVTANVTFARGFAQGATSEFLAQTSRPLTVAGLNITNSPQYQHRVDEIQLSSAGGVGGLLDTNRIEVDGMLLMNYKLTSLPTITGGSAKPFIFGMDLHYQTDRNTTPNKAPNFYG